jgi:hypothetical protein
MSGSDQSGTGQYSNQLRAQSSKSIANKSVTKSTQRVLVPGSATESQSAIEEHKRKLREKADAENANLW